MNKINKIEINDICFSESSFLKDVKDDLNNEIDLVNTDIEKYYELQKICIGNEEALKEMNKLDVRISGHLFTIRDRISLMRDPTFSSSIPEVFKEELMKQLDSVYDKCKARQNFI